MAVVIPKTQLSGVPLDTDRRGVRPVHVDKSLAGALANFGGAITNAALEFQDAQSKEDAFNDEGKFMLYREQAETAFDEAKRQMPAEATGFASGFLTQRAAADKQFLDGLTPASRQKIEPRLVAFSERLKNHALDEEFKARSKVELESIGINIDQETARVMNDPSYRDQAIANIGAALHNLSALSPLKQQELKTIAARQIEAAQARGEYKGRSQELARALGVPHPLSQAALPEQSTPGGRMAPDDVRAVMLNEVKRQGLVGMVPQDGAKYGIKTGSAEEWANLFTGLAKHESGFDNRTVGDVGQFAGGSRGLLQLSYNDAQSYGFNNGKPFTSEQLADPNFNAAVGIAIAKNLIAKNGSIQGGMGKYWGPISKEGWTPGQGRDRGLPWARWGASVGSGPTASAAAAAPGGAPPDPRFKSLALEDRLKLVEQAYREEQQTATKRQAEVRAFQTANKEQFNLAIANDDDSVTPALINQKIAAGELDVGDGAALIEKLKAQEKKGADARAFLSAMQDGSLVAAPFDQEQNKAADAAYEQIKKVAQPDQMQPVAEEFAKKHGSAPKDYVQSIRGEIERFDNPQAVLSGLQKAQRLRQANVTALSREGYGSVEKAAVDFSYMVDHLGFSPEEAARKYISLNDPAKRKDIDDRMATKEAEKLKIGDVTDHFDTWLSWEPTGGFDHEQQKAVLGDFRELFKIEYRETGDASVAKGRALARFERMYGPTELSGSKVLMKYPPEKYNPQLDGSHAWMQKQLLDAVKEATGEDYKPDRVGIVATKATDADVRAGRAPAYEIWVDKKDENGQPRFEPITGRGRFVFDYRMAVNGPELLKRRTEEMQRLQKNRDDTEEMQRLQKNRDDVAKAGFGWEFLTRALAP